MGIPIAGSADLARTGKIYDAQNRGNPVNANDLAARNRSLVSFARSVRPAIFCAIHSIHKTINRAGKSSVIASL